MFGLDLVYGFNCGDRGGGGGGGGDAQGQGGGGLGSPQAREVCVEHPEWLSTKTVDNPPGS